MGLLHLINTENDKNYISLFEAINLLAKKTGSDIYEVATYLLNKDVHIQLYSHTRDIGYKIVQTSYGGAFDVAWVGENDAFGLLSEIIDIEKNFSEKFIGEYGRYTDLSKSTFWDKQAFFNNESIVTAINYNSNKLIDKLDGFFDDIDVRDDNVDNYWIEPIEPDYEAWEEIDKYLTEEYELELKQRTQASSKQCFDDYRNTFFKYDIFNGFEVACLISGYNPNDLTIDQTRYVVWRDNNPNFVSALNLVMSADVGQDALWYEGDESYYECKNNIKNEDLKNYLVSKNIIIDGFNDNLPTQEPIGCGQPSIQQVDPNIENLNAEIKQLKDLITSKDIEINGLTHTINELGGKNAKLIEYNSDLYEENTSLAKKNENNENTIRGLNNSALWQESENSDLEIENRNLKTKIKELEASHPNEQIEIQTIQPESKLSTREENNIIRVLAVVMELERKIDMSKPYEAHGIMAQKAQLLGIDPFPSNESIKKWFAKANEYKKS